MKKVLYKSHTIPFQEHSGGKTLPRAFDTPKEHLDFHLKNLQKMPDVGDGFSQKSEPLIRGVKVVTKQS